MREVGMWLLAAWLLGAGAAVAQGAGSHGAGSAVTAAPAASSSPSEPEDKYLWLEEVSSPRSLAWVKTENARTAAVLEQDPHYAGYYAEALKIAEDPHRLPTPRLVGDTVYNTWRDAANPRGLLRRTTLADYLTATPHWQTVLDVDALGRAEHTGWVLRSYTCLYPGDRLCMVELSAGGEDAVTAREFDLQQGKFVEGGFVLPHSKQVIAWVDQDTLLVGRDWGAGTLTASGYPYVIKRWKRGTPLASAEEVYRGAQSDVRAYAQVLKDAQGDTLETFTRGVSFFEDETSILTPRGIERLALPLKATLHGVLAGRLLVQVNESWIPAPGAKPVIAGSVVELKLADLRKDPAHLHPLPVFTPSAEEFLENLATTQDALILTTLNHVQGRAYVYTPEAAGWSAKRLPLGENIAIDVESADHVSDRFFLGVAGFLTPSSLWLGDAANLKGKEVKVQPPQFDAAGEAVDQYDARSQDGTLVPYFVVHPKGMKLDGSNPTLLYAYGGFEVAMTPSYSGTLGKLWLEHGGVYVLANIRGGGEFGPAWHEAGLKTKRQRIYDDFAAVGQDLVARRITSPRRLGIEGGSNGGLLMGVEMTQHPEMWNAIVIQVPLLDMLRFEKIAAGASWVGEYGSVAVPAERTFLACISPYNQLKPGVKYPEPLIFTTTKDDRVGPQHARKFAAKMEEYHLPFLYDEIVEGGHGAGADLKQIARTQAETFAYLERKLMQ